MISKRMEWNGSPVLARITKRAGFYCWHDEESFFTSKKEKRKTFGKAENYVRKPIHKARKTWQILSNWWENKKGDSI